MTRAIAPLARFAARCALCAALAGAPRSAHAGPVTLERCLELASQHSPLLRQGQARIDQAQADVHAARAGYLPRVTASASWNHLDTGRLSPMATPEPGRAATLYGREAWAGVRVRQPLFDGLRTRNAGAAAASAVEAERSGFSAGKADVVWTVTRSFVQLLEAQHLAGVAERALERQVAFEKQVAAQLQAGRGSRLDEAKARAQRLEAERGAVAAREAAGAAEAALRKAMGLAPGERLQASGELVAPGAPPAEPALVEAAEQANPDLQRLTAQVEQARASASAAGAPFWPEVSAQGSWGYRDRDTGGGATEWSAGVFLDWSLYEGGATTAQVAKARARVRELEELRRALELQVRTDAREALAAWRTALAAAQSTREQAEAARTALEAATALFDAGRATSLEVLTAQADVARAEAGHVVALGDAVLAQARTQRLVGDAAREPPSRGLTAAALP